MANILPRERVAFTVLELLGTIAIIAVLAALLVGLAPLASRTMKEYRIRADMRLLTSLIEDYKSTLGFYPPDGGTNFLNPLFYELTGAVFKGNHFEALDGAVIRTEDLVYCFEVHGVANSARRARDVKFKHDFKSSQYGRFTNGPVSIQTLFVPVPHPYYDFRHVSPWRYDSSSPGRHNPESFDLWVDVKLGKEELRFANWSKDPIPLPDTPE